MSTDRISCEVSFIDIVDKPRDVMAFGVKK